MVTQPSSHARATALTAWNLLEPLRVKADSASHGQPLLTLRTNTVVAATALALAAAAIVGTMMLRHGGGHSYQGGDRLRVGSSRIPANHIGRIPPAYDPRHGRRYSFHQYMQDMQQWILVTDLPPHQQVVLILRHLGGAAQDLISQIPPNELFAGATVDGTHLGPAASVLLKFHHRFAQQDIVSRMSAM